jgi:hypothetical protein
MLAKGIWLYIQVLLTVIAIVTGLGAFQAAINAHNTLSLLVGLLTLLGLPPLVAFMCKLMSDQLN